MAETFNVDGQLLVAFDGHCGFCNGSVRWLLKRDRRDRFRFVALDSEKIAGVLARHSLSGLDRSDGSVVVVRGTGRPEEIVLVRSDAVMALLNELPNPWPQIGLILKLIPRPLRDLAYRLVARSRYRIWGRLESCRTPTAEEREKFL